MKKRFFISHSSEDKELVELFVNSILVTGLRIRDEEIYCSSLNGLGNKSGEDFVIEIKSALESAEVSILIISENYKMSEICLNEMGASWASKSHVIPVVVEPISYKQVGALNLQKQCEKIFNEDSIHNIRQTIEDKTQLDPTKVNRWNSIVEAFIRDAKKIELKKPKTVSLQAHQKLASEKKSLQEEFDEISDELDQKNDYIKVLETKKDKAEIDSAKKESGISGFEDEFEEKISAVKDALLPFNKITVMILLCNFHGQPHPNLETYGDPIDESIRKKFLTTECESGEKSANIELNKALTEVDDMGLESAFCDWYKEEENEAFDPSDEEFWKKFYKIKI